MSFPLTVRYNFVFICIPASWNLLLYQGVNLIFFLMSGAELEG